MYTEANRITPFKRRRSDIVHLGGIALSSGLLWLYYSHVSILYERRNPGAREGERERGGKRVGRPLRLARSP